MKTNQVMRLDFNGKSLEIEHKTQMGSLTELWAIGNSIRKEKGLTEMSMENYLRSPETLELVQAIEKSLHSKGVISTDLKTGLVRAGSRKQKADDEVEKENGRIPTITSQLIRTKRGRYGGGTWAYLYILLDAASRLDADFKVMMYDILVNGKLLEWRDDSGDSFKALNIVLDATIVAQTGTRPSTALYIRVANCIKDKINPTGGDWNTATYDELKMRSKVENQTMVILKLGFIKSEAELMRAIREM